MTPSHRFLIVEDHEVVTLAVKTVILENFQNASVDTAGSFTMARKMLSNRSGYALVVLDMDVPGGEAYNMVGVIQGLQPKTRILVFSGKDESEHAINFLTVGANGYLSKSAPLPELGTAIRMLMAGRRYISPEVQQIITNRYFEEPDQRNAEKVSFSPRENEVFELLLAGKMAKEIASELNMKISTVSTHKARIFEKMQVSNVIDLYKKYHAGK